MNLIVMITALISFSSVYGFELVSTQIEKAQIKLVDDYFQVVNNLLPEIVKRDLPKTVDVRFNDLDSKVKGMKGLVKKKIFQRKSKIKVIHLDHSILEMLKNPKNENKSAHQSNEKQAVAVLLHELIHLYDYQNIFLEKEKEMAKSCRDERKAKSLSRKEKRTCRRLKKKKFTMSDSRLFSNLAGWNALGLLKKKNKQHNRNYLRSPDRYEFTNRQEFLGVNFEFFILDPEYKCRRPNLYSYFSESFETKPHDSYRCETSTKVLMTSEALQGKEAAVIDLDPKKVYQVHYLFAGKGKAIMSRWGHAMIRIIMCAPHREVVDENCLKDIAYHLVLSFRANITGTSMSYAKGMNGSYDSLMFLLPMKDVVKEYTQGEFRDVFSVPLRLDTKQKSQMMKTILSQYWAYRGAYYFASNNCANETLKMIRLGFKDDLHIQAMTVITPNQIFDNLEKMGLGDMSVLEDRKLAVKKGYLFEAAHKKLEKAFERIVSSGAKVNFINYEKFLEESSASQRADILNHLSRMEKSVDKRKALASAFKIENFLFERKQLELVGLLANFINEQKRNNTLDPAIGKYLEEYAELQNSLLPENIISSGYGIPLKSEINDRFEHSTKGATEQIMSVGDTLIEWAKESHNDQLEELKSIQENKLRSLKELQANI